MQKKLSHTRKKLIQIIPRDLVFLGIVCTLTLFLTAAGSQESQQSRPRSRHIVTSIPPLEGIVRALVDESIGVSTVIHGDPHSFIPRPSDAALVRNADAVIVIDPSFERSFVPLLESHGNTKNLLILSQLSALELLAQRGDHHHHEDHDATEDHHEDEDHDAARDHHEDMASDHHGSDDAIDYHIWLDPYNTGRIAQGIAQRLTVLYPEQKATIEKNLQNFLEELAMLKARLDNTLAPIRNLPYSVVHDGLQYFAAAFSFSNSTALFLNQPEALSGLRFTEILEQIREAGIQVLFLEEQFPPSAVRAIAERGNVRMVSIDPLGMQIPMNDRHYFALMESLAKTMHDALINN